MTTDAHYDRGNMLYDAKQYQLASKQFAEHVGENPSDALGHGMLALSQAALGNYREAERCAKAAIAAEPANHFGHYSLAWVFYKIGQQEKARKCILEALRLHPTRAYYHGLHGDILNQLHKNKEALAAAQQGLQFEPENVLCLNVCSLGHYALNENKQAMRCAQDVLRIQPESAVAHATVGHVQLQDGKVEEAVASFTEALRLSPHQERARQGLVKAYRRRHKAYAGFAVIAEGMSTVQNNKALFVTTMVIPQLRALYLLLALIAYLGTRIVDVLIRWDPLTRRALTSEEIINADCFLGWALSGLLVTVIFCLVPSTTPAILAAVFVWLAGMLPLAMMTKVPAGYARKIVAWYTGVTLAIGLGFVAWAMMLGKDLDKMSESEAVPFVIFLVAVIGSLVPPCVAASMNKRKQR